MGVGMGMHGQKGRKSRTHATSRKVCGSQQAAYEWMHAGLHHMHALRHAVIPRTSEGLSAEVAERSSKGTSRS